MDKSNEQSVTIDIPSQEVTPPVETPPVAPPVEPIPADPNRDEKGQFVEGNQVAIGNKGGKTCEYCANTETLQKIVDNYINHFKEDIKPSIPWVEELALLLDVSDVTLVNWVNKKDDNDKLEHPVLVSAYGKLKTLQKFRLKQRAVGRFNPHGALYLLNADHKVVQTDRKVIANDDREPLQIMFVKEKPIPGEGIETSE